jgi:hypothetical protein
MDGQGAAEGSCPRAARAMLPVLCAHVAHYAPRLQMLGRSRRPMFMWWNVVQCWLCCCCVSLHLEAPNVVFEPLAAQATNTLPLATQLATVYHALNHFHNRSVNAVHQHSAQTRKLRWTRKLMDKRWKCHHSKCTCMWGEWNSNTCNNSPGCLAWPPLT